MSAVVLNDKILGVMSDTHGSFPAWLKAREMFGPEVRTILHAGDVLYHGPRNAIPGGYGPADLMASINDFYHSGGKVLFAVGNCDAAIDITVLEPEFKRCVEVDWRGKKIVMMHGDYFESLRQAARKTGAVLAISGHTHVPGITREDGVIYLNPGSTTIPKQADPIPTAAILDDEGIHIKTLDGRELRFEKW